MLNTSLTVAGRSDSIALHLPDDFPRDAYAAIRAAVIARAPASERLDEFDDAWHALAHRFIAFSDDCQRFDAPPLVDGERVQDAALFGAFSSGVACIECYCYAMFALGALIEPALFPLASPTDKRNATAGATLRLFGQVFHDAALTRALFWWLNSREFGWWREIRAMLAQRVAPRSADGHWQLRGVDMDSATMRQKRAWLVEALTKLLHDTQVFITDTSFR